MFTITRLTVYIAIVLGLLSVGTGIALYKSNSVNQTQVSQTSEANSSLSYRSFSSSLSVLRSSASQSTSSVYYSSSLSSSTSSVYNFYNGDVFVSYTPTQSVNSSVQSSSISSSQVSSVSSVPPPFTGIIIPMYEYPGDIAYTNLIAVKQSHPTISIIAIINVSGSDIGNNIPVRDAFATEATRLHNAGIKVLGYVDTSYSARPLTQVQVGSCSVDNCANPGITTYTSNGIYIDGVFADQVCAGYIFGACTTLSIPYYQNLYTFVHVVADLPILMTNQGGSIVNNAYYSSTDFAITFDNDISAYSNSLYTVGNTHASQDAAILYNTGSTLNTNIVQYLKNKVKYLYLTPDTLPNPWDTLPSYLGSIATLLQ